MRSILALAATAALLVGCNGKKDEPPMAERTEGPVVSSPEDPQNPPIDTTPTTGETTQTPGANSFTEAQARSAIEAAGYTNVSSLTQNPEGLWQGKASKSGKETSVSVDYKGAVTPQ